MYTTIIQGRWDDLSKQLPHESIHFITEREVNDLEHFVCNLSDLNEKKSHVYVVNDVEVALILLDNEVFAYDNICPHARGPVGLGDLFGRVKVELGPRKEEIREYVDENEMALVCPWHGMEFNAKTGVNVADSSMCLQKINVIVRDEKVYVDL